MSTTNFPLVAPASPRLRRRTADQHPPKWTGRVPGVMRPADELAGFMAVGRVQRFPRHSQLTVQGASVNRVCILLTGHAKEHHLTRDGGEVVTCLYGPRDIVGLVSSTDGTVAVTSVTALEPLTALLVDNATTRRLIEDDTDARAVIQRTLTRQLEDAKLLLVEQSMGGARERVISRLIRLVDDWGRQRGSVIEIDIPLTQAELGSWAGLSREATVKALRGLRDAGILLTSHRHITILDIDELRRSASVDTV